MTSRFDNDDIKSFVDEDGFTVFFDKEARELLRVKFPPNVTRAEMRKFIKHLERYCVENRN